MTSQTSERPLILSTKDEAELLLTPEEQAAQNPKKVEEAVKEEVVEQTEEVAQSVKDEASADDASRDGDFSQDDYNSLKEYAKKSGFKSANGLIKSYESSRAWTDRTRQKNKDLEQKINLFEEKLLGRESAPPAAPSAVTKEQVKEAFYKAWEENPVEAIQSIADYHTQTKVMPALHQMSYEKQVEISRMATKQAQKNLKMWDRAKDRVKEILEDDGKFQTLSKAAKTLEDKYDVLEMAYERALKLEGLEEPTAPRVAVSSESTKAPRVETGSDADAGTRLPKRKKSINEDIADSIIAPTSMDEFNKRFFGKR